MGEKKEKKVVIVTFADLGKKENLKTVIILPLISLFREKNLLSKIFCRINKNFDFPETFSNVPQFIHYPLAFWGRFFKKTLKARILEEKIFDFFLSFKIKKSPEEKMIFFHPDYSFPKSIKIAKEQGFLTIGITSTAHAKYNANLEKEEFERLGLERYFEKYSVYRNFLKEGFYQNELDYLIAISPFVKETYIQSGMPEEKIFVVNSDIDLSKFSPLKNKKETIFQVIYVAQTTVLKGLHYLLQAWQKLRIKNKKLFLVGGWAFCPPDFKK
ncbi:MAG: hypothetical protein ACPLZH_02940, partial [Minisyncoccales bacterium]